MKKIHNTAEIEKNVRIGENTIIWHQAQIRKGVRIGKNCIIGKGVYLDEGIIIGDNVKIQNYASIYHNAAIEDDVFIGPYCCFTNDVYPRATWQGTLKTNTMWDAGTTTVKQGASLGAGTILLPNITIGQYALIGAGSLITKNIPPHALAHGHPAKIQGFVCTNGHILTHKTVRPLSFSCKICTLSQH